MKYTRLKTYNWNVKNIIGILGLIFVSFIFSCSPTIHYLGDSYEKTTNIDVYYDDKDIEKEYRTIGNMTHDMTFDYEAEKIKNAMIRKAKEKGGDGIIFIETNVSRGHEWDEDRLSVTAKIIKYI